MPVHDWTHPEDGLFRTVHNAWLIHLLERLNGGLLPKGYYTLTDARIGVYQPDPTTARQTAPGRRAGRTATLPAADRETSVLIGPGSRQRLLKVFDDRKRVVAAVEVVSPANKDRKRSVADFAGKVADFLASGVHVAVADLLPPGPADPGGMHPPVWKALSRRAKPDRPAADRPLTFASYRAGPEVGARLYDAAVGRPLPTLPLFLDDDRFVLLPLDETYTETVSRLPAGLRATIGAGHRRGGCRCTTGGRCRRGGSTTSTSAGWWRCGPP